MAAPTTARFSTGVCEVDKAPKFKWEFPVPDTPFWSSLRYPSARNFLECFSNDEVEGMKLEQHNSLNNQQKAELLIQLLERKISDNSSPSKPLWVTDNRQWMKIKMAIGTLYGEKPDLDSQIRVAEELQEKRADKSNLSHQHSLAAMLLLKDDCDYKEVEELETPCLPQMIETAGNDSPQAMSSRRILAKAIWMQGRHEEAEKIFQEIFSLLESSATGKYAVYRASETNMTKQLVDELKK
jgi:hypothetical protein